MISHEIPNIDVAGEPLGRIFFARGTLIKLRRKARRSGAWFKALGRGERALMELAIAVVKDRVRSSLLANLLASIAIKLLEAMGGLRALMGEVAYGMVEVGLPLARRLSEIARSWGNESASGWPEDRGFIQYLTIMELNRP
jgi:hypothetical protein